MPIAAAAVAAAGTIGSAIISSDASKSAANAQAAANDRAIAAQQAQYQQTRSDLSPWRTAGTSALDAQSDLLGLNGTAAQKTAIDNLKASPLYQTLFSNGENTVLANASATGGLRGGNTESSLANFGRDTLSSVIEDQLTNLGGVSTSGQNAAAQTGSLGQSSTNNISQLLSDTGAANASSALASGGAATGAVNSLAQILATALGKNTNSSLAGSVQQTVANNPSIF